MEEYTKMTLMQAAAALSRKIETLTGRFPVHTTFIRILRAKATALPKTLATSAVEFNLAASVDALKRAYEQAHDAEYVLLFSLLFRYVPYADASGLFDDFYNVKRLIIAELKGTNGTNPPSPVR
jgi:hypothetical protein